MGHKNWSDEEKQYLADNWGMLSMATLTKKLERSENAINVMVFKLGLGPFLINGEYVGFYQLLCALGYANSGYKYKAKSWIEERNCPVKMKKVNNNSFRVIYLQDFWEWAEQNKSFLDFSNFEVNLLGKEPEWVKAKRKQDAEWKRQYKTTPWTAIDDSKLKKLLKTYKYTYDDLSKILHRTNGAIQRRISELNLKERPLKERIRLWTDQEEIKIEQFIIDGLSYELVAGKLNRSVKTVRGKIGRMFGTENLDKVRKILESRKEKQVI